MPQVICYKNEVDDRLNSFDILLLFDGKSFVKINNAFEVNKMKNIFLNICAIYSFMTFFETELNNKNYINFVCPYNFLALYNVAMIS